MIDSPPPSTPTQNFDFFVNGEKKSLKEPSTLAELLTRFGYHGNYFAVAINRTFIPRSNYESTLIQDRDEIEILCPMQGG